MTPVSRCSRSAPWDCLLRAGLTWTPVLLSDYPTNIFSIFKYFVPEPQNPKLMVPTYACALNFDLKFEILRETPWKVLIIIMKDDYTPGRPIGIRFEK